MKVTRSGACGNSPKNAFVEDFAVDLARGADLSGKLDTGASAPDWPWPEAVAVTIQAAISHGKVGAAEGYVEVDGKRLGFVVTLRFTNTKAQCVAEARLYSDA
ncbi:MAG: hypothetical protein KIT02_16215 [Devosia sp.]|uniref:hypothetical protein n=1 Tax=Devosia sp. TaxID=1871048 RepID=UPI0024CC18EA|nr:hypothetical protein [Devosia sp.]UYN99431.1 MAG: hypothetical protein KIT02_16215 [Devosia sp.]